MTIEPTAKSAADLKTMAITFGVVVGLAFGINAAFGSRSLLSRLQEGPSLPEQIILGVGIGFLFSGITVGAVLRTSAFLRFREHCIARSRLMDLSGLNPIWISLFAGIGEEILFRGTIQPLLGLWLTSVVFALIHIQPSQYRNPTAGTLGYAAFVFFVSLLLGELYSQVGLVTAMAFHTSGDVIGLLSLQRLAKTAIV